MTAEMTSKKPKKWLMAALPLALVAGGVWMWLDGGRYETTENANLQIARISVASDLAGRVTESFAQDSRAVKAGEPLFTVDPEPYRLALAQADAALAQARLGVAQLRAAYRAAVAQEKVAQDNADYLTAELARQEKITNRGAGTGSALDAARHEASAAGESLAAARQNVAAALAALGGDPAIATDAHPVVKAAQVARDKAAYDLTRTTVKAPADGVIYKASSFKPGQFVSAGATLFTLVETGDLWVEANFKETQLEHIAPGQTAEIEFDTFPGRAYTAVVEAVGAGTGAEFALIPAQNATGNWVKVTQRVPVRLRLSGDAPKDGLRAGLSASVTIDTHASTHLDSILAQAGSVEN